MLGTELAKLAESDRADIVDAFELVNDIDAALVSGLARPDTARDAALTRLSSAFAATPLADRLAKAAGDIAAGQVTEDGMVALAAGRSALLGAVHDALLTDLDTALGRTRTRAAGDGDAAVGVRPGSPSSAACRAWLTELAITGLRGIDETFVSSAGTVVEELLADPKHRRLGLLLDGWCAELRRGMPVAAMPEIPRRRWADLWTRAMILTESTYPEPTEADRVSGRLLPIGVDVFDHETIFGVVVHGAFESGGQTRLVRATVTAPKVEVVHTAAMWGLLSGLPQLTAALAGDRALDLVDMPITDHGDLLWNDANAQVGAEVDPMATARMCLEQATAASIAPLDRHPAVIAEPVFVESYRVVKGEPLQFDLGGATVDIERISAAGPITDKHVAASKACIGILRWENGRWALTPVAVLTPVKRQPTVVHTGQWAQGPTDPKVAKAVARTDAITVLRERAGRLLRT